MLTVASYDCKYGIIVTKSPIGPPNTPNLREHEPVAHIRQSESITEHVLSTRVDDSYSRLGGWLAQSTPQPVATPDRTPDSQASSRSHDVELQQRNMTGTQLLINFF